jgi:hypothetical protein
VTALTVCVADFGSAFHFFHGPLEERRASLAAILFEIFSVEGVDAVLKDRTLEIKALVEK